MRVLLKNFLPKNGFFGKTYLLMLVFLLVVIFPRGSRAGSFGLDVSGVLEKHSSEVSALGFALKLPLLVSATEDGTLAVWDVKKQECLWKMEAHKKEVTSASFCGGDKYVVSGSLDERLILWEVETGKKVKEFPDIKKDITDVEVNWGGSVIAAATGSVINLFNIKTGMRLSELKGHKKDVLAMGFSVNGDRLISVGKDKRIILWDVNTKKRIRSLEERADEVYSAAFNNDSTVYFLGVKDIEVAHQGISTTDDSGIGGVDEMDFIQIRDGTSGVGLGRLKGHDGTINAMAISPDLLYIASASKDKTLKVWNLDLKKEVAEFGCPAVVTSVAFNPTGKWLAAGTQDGKIYLYRCRGVGQYPQVVLRDGEIYRIPTLPPYTGEKSTLAIFPIKTENSDLKNLLPTVTDFLITEFLNSGRFKIIDRENVERIVKEVRACQAGYLEEGCMEEMKVKGTEKMITGSLSRIGRKYVITIKLTDLSTGRIVSSATERALITKEDLDLLAKSVVYKICAPIR
ncbi:MAG: hypothetical protein JRJ79_13140 [Deltaproteobacteria bacterium]|nr:hypothetical protein [Deltaproteobacteria bacterium]